MLGLLQGESFPSQLKEFLSASQILIKYTGT